MNSLVLKYAQKNVPVINPDYDLKKTLKIMIYNDLSELPVIDSKNKFIGTVKNDAILDIILPEYMKEIPVTVNLPYEFSKKILFQNLEPLKNIKLSSLIEKNPTDYIKEDLALIDALKIMIEKNTNLLNIINNNNNFVGIITKNDIVKVIFDKI